VEIVVLAFAISIVIWVLFDARSRDWSQTGYANYSPVFWAAVVALFGVIFLPAYLIVRRKSRPRGRSKGMKRCPDCAELVQGDAAICRFCRHRFATHLRSAA
jgi:O-antigen/teichoic acid export membrane protein